ncbi:MAG: MBL fold metallo-hydrolase [Alloprevotella sp.]|nr:MBL fold metallo-hydrolase [Alloprevotella sp.]
MGHPKTYTQVLKDVISGIVRTSEQIDAIFLSHIHDDHIGGACRFIKDIQMDCTLENVVGRWIYNAPRKYGIEKIRNEQNGVLCGIVSGDKVYEYILVNRPSDINDVTEGLFFDIDGMKVTILSPDVNTLNLLRYKYSNNRPLSKSETDEISIEAGGVADDYSVPLLQFKTDKFREDTNIENASSIAAIFEYRGKRVLWLSDSIPSVVVGSLLKLGYSETNKMQCDVVLLSHHGSSANNSLDLFKMISANKYIISADGINRHCLPNKETVARIVAASSNIPVSLYFNYDNGRLTKMFKSDALEDVRLMIDIHYLKDKEVIEF